MSETNTAPEQGTIGIRNIYLKDSSFEAPSTPHIFNEKANPDINVNIGVDSKDLGNNFFEVIISITITAKIEEKTAFLAEVHQGGVFEISGFDTNTQRAIKGIFCPTQLFPYAREAVSSLIGRGGFPPLLLEPINFEEMFAQQATSTTENIDKIDNIDKDKAKQH